MRASADKLYSVADVVPNRAAGRRTRIALTSPLFALGGVALGSVAVWAALFKLILG